MRLSLANTFSSASHRFYTCYYAVRTEINISLGTINYGAFISGPNCIHELLIASHGPNAVSI